MPLSSKSCFVAYVNVALRCQRFFFFDFEKQNGLKNDGGCRPVSFKKHFMAIGCCVTFLVSLLGKQCAV